MPTFPIDDVLPTGRLAACFRSTVTTYKFYWFLAILKKVEQGQTVISKRDLFAEMVAHAWFTVNYFHVSFGKQDQFQQAIAALMPLENITADAKREAVSAQLAVSTNSQTLRILRAFNGEVPHRFLSPWFPADNKAQAYQLSQRFTNDCPYALGDHEIVVNPNWLDYFQRNAGILRDFCYWNLSVYLQVRNPNVPDIPNKLIRQPQRKALTEQRKVWDLVINELGSVDCIYTNTRLIAGGYAVEHFIPFAFVSHDLMWNLIPANPAFNSSKSDRLPLLDRYFGPFYHLQHQAVEIIRKKAPRHKILQDYLTIFPLIETQPLDKQKYLEQLQPLVTIASNNGFEFMRAV